MTDIGFHCSDEQITPAQLLRDVHRNESADESWFLGAAAAGARA